MKLKTYSGAEVLELRRKLGLNQREFWAPFQTTQSGGSRANSGGSRQRSAPLGAPLRGQPNKGVAPLVPALAHRVHGRVLPAQ